MSSILILNLELVSKSEFWYRGNMTGLTPVGPAKLLALVGCSHRLMHLSYIAIQHIEGEAFSGKAAFFSFRR